jgi:hypothetical protein
VIRKGQEMVYRKSGPVLLCVFCADKDPLVDTGRPLPGNLTGWARIRDGRAPRLPGAAGNSAGGQRHG